MASMVRKQIYLTRAQDRRLKQLAARLRRAVAEIIRAALDRELGSDEQASPSADDPFLDIIGLGRSGKRDLSEHVDHYLYGAPRKSKA
jgi:hypothetical protein